MEGLFSREKACTLWILKLFSFRNFRAEAIGEFWSFCSSTIKPFNNPYPKKFNSSVKQQFLSLKTILKFHFNFAKKCAYEKVEIKVHAFDLNFDWKFPSRCGSSNSFVSCQQPLICGLKFYISIAYTLQSRLITQILSFNFVFLSVTMRCKK